MSQEFIAGKRYPRGMRRNIKSKGKNPCSYYDVGKSMRSSSPEEYDKKIAEMKKMGNFS